jgi:hypothetical protein
MTKPFVYIREIVVKFMAKKGKLINYLFSSFWDPGWKKVGSWIDIPDPQYCVHIMLP